jgi:hypothetical protein
MNIVYWHPLVASILGIFSLFESMADFDLEEVGFDKGDDMEDCESENEPDVRRRTE